MARQRIRLSNDEIDASAERKLKPLPRDVVGAIVNHSRRNYWRVAAWYEIDDLIQDGLVVAYRCQRRYGYPGIDLDPPHFQSLVMSSFSRHIIDLTRNKTKEKDEIKLGDFCLDMTDEKAAEFVSGGEEGDQNYAVLIADLPEYLRKAVRFCLSPEGVEARRNSRESSLNRILRRFTDLPEGVDFEQDLRSYLWMDDRGLVTK